MPITFSTWKSFRPILSVVEFYRFYSFLTKVSIDVSYTFSSPIKSKISDKGLPLRVSHKSTLSFFYTVINAVTKNFGGS